MNEFPILTTERLVLRAMRPSDATDVLTFRGDPEVLKYDGPLIHTVQEAIAFVEEVQQEGKAQTSVAWGIALPETDQLIGSVGLWYWDHYHRRAEIGYGLATGYGFERVARREVPHRELRLSQQRDPIHSRSRRHTAPVLSRR